jgi:multiple sugar transport system ATP-binding protein
MSIKFENVAKSFGNSIVVEDLNLAIDSGEFVVLLGPSGCGKTTTLRMLAGLETVSSGDIFVDDQRINDVPTQHRDLAMVFQSYALYPHMTIADNIGYPLRIRKLDAKERSERINRVAAMLDIEPLLNRKPRQLSGGERQRVALARAIVREPRAYLMDEPLSNLDARLRVQMRGELKRLQHQLGTTTVYVTHDQAEAMTLAHRVAVMKKGRLQQFDTPMNVYERPANRFIAEFVGSPSMNLVEGTIDGSRFSTGDLSVELPESRLKQLSASESGRMVTLGIRPEHIRISTSENEGGIPGRIYITEEMGNETVVIVSVGNLKLTARAPAEFRVEPETKVWFKLMLEKSHLFDHQSGARINKN